MAADNAALVIEMDFDWSKADKGVDDGARKLLQFQSTIEGLASVDFSNLSSQIANLTKNLSKVNSGSGTKDAEIDLQNLAKATAEAELAQLRLTNAQNRGKTVSQGDNYKQLSQDYREAAVAAQDYAAKIIIAGGNLKTLENDQSFQKLAKNAKAAYEQLAVIDESVGKFGRRVGDYAGGISSAFGQTFSRTAHAAAEAMIGMQRGVNALAVDLPNLIEQFRHMSAEQKAIKASGGEAMSTIELLKAAFNPLTLAVNFGIMALVKYGGEIYRWATGAEDAKKKAEELKKANDELTSSYTGSLKSSASEIANLKILATTAENENLQRNVRLDAVKKMKSEYPDLLKNYSTEDILNKRFAVTLEGLIKQLFAAAQAKAMMAKVDTLAQQEIDNEDKATVALTKLKNARLEYSKAVQNQKDAQAAGTTAGALIGYANQVSAKYNTLQKAELGWADAKKRGVDNILQENKLLKQSQDEVVKSGNAATHALGTDTTKDGKTKLTQAQKDANQSQQIIKRYYDDLDNLQTDFSGGFINENEFNKQLITLTENARKQLNRLHIPSNETVIAQLFGTEKDARQMVTRFQVMAEQLESGTKIFKESQLKNTFGKVDAKIDTPNLFASDSQGESINKSIRLISELGKKGLTYNKLQDKTEDGLKSQAKILGQNEKLYGKLNEQAAELGGQVAGNLVQGLLQGQSVLQSFSGILSGLIAQFAQLAAQSAILSLLGGIASGGTGPTITSFGGIFSHLLGGGRAIGGAISKGSIYPVNEFGSELLNIGSKQYLMAGANGSIKPITAPSIQSPNMSNAKPNVVRVVGEMVASGRTMKATIKNYDNYKSL